MFGARFFPGRMFAARFFPKVGAAEPAPATGMLVFELVDLDKFLILRVL